MPHFALILDSGTWLNSVDVKKVAQVKETHLHGFLLRAKQFQLGFSHYSWHSATKKCDSCHKSLSHCSLTTEGGLKVSLVRKKMSCSSVLRSLYWADYTTLRRWNSKGGFLNAADSFYNNDLSLFASCCFSIHRSTCIGNRWIWGYQNFIHWYMYLTLQMHTFNG